ncbi:MAG: histidinol dehydrogenase [Lachnospiraceae bacterium]|jgi:histidinol dehydrogenase|nr:histidinol dehydrogenase [Lachnospiraceae bacterium]
MRIVVLDKVNQENILTNLLERGVMQFSEHEKTVAEIVTAVKNDGDTALFHFSQKFDRFSLEADNIRVTAIEIAAAYEWVDDGFVKAMKRAAANIGDFHQKQKQNSWFDIKDDGSVLGQRVTALDSVGVYAPGGTAAYMSSVLMNVIPAKVAGVKRIVLATPPDQEGNIAAGILVAADIAGVDEIYKVGGAQAIAALAYGTQSIPKVDKITGPGNIFVTLAKKAVYGVVGIDSLAGPSEILIIADETANPVYIAADLLSQAEHDELASAVLVTVSRRLAEAVSLEVAKQMEELPRKAIAAASLARYGYILLVSDLDEAAVIANDIAAEHVEILTADPFMLMAKIRHAGAIFLGEHSPEPLGDYFAGTNHVLPTNGTARFSSGLGVDDFCKKTSIISYTAAALRRDSDEIMAIAGEEGLHAHANAIKVREEVNQG